MSVECVVKSSGGNAFVVGVYDRCLFMLVNILTYI